VVAETNLSLQTAAEPSVHRSLIAFFRTSPSIRLPVLQDLLLDIWGLPNGRIVDGNNVRVGRTLRRLQTFSMAGLPELFQDKNGGVV
jgi:hypothetical protein